MKKHTKIKPMNESDQLTSIDFEKALKTAKICIVLALLFFFGAIYAFLHFTGEENRLIFFLPTIMFLLLFFIFLLFAKSTRDEDSGIPLENMLGSRTNL